MIHALLATLLLAQAAPVQPGVAPATPKALETPEAPAADSPRTRAEAMLTAKDARAELLYNAGVEMYRAGELELARELFATAASKAKANIAARSMYNRGTTSYAEAVEAMKGAGESGQPAADAQKAVMESLERSLRELKDAVRADPSNTDARANAELAYRVLKELKKQQEQQEQQQQQQDQQKQDEQKQDQKQDQKNGQDQDPQQQDQQQQDQQKNDDSQKQDEKQDGKQDQQQEQTNGEQKDEQQQPQDGEQKQDEQQQAQTAEADKKPMTKQEVERLLQRIRDKERARILEKLSKERARTKPAPKDW